MLRLSATAVLAILAVFALCAAILIARVAYIGMPALERPADGDVVYLFVGSDAEIERDPGDVQYGTSDDEARADAIVLVRLGAGGDATAVAIPRDLLASGSSRRPLAQSLRDGPAALMADICATTGVAVDRYLGIDGAGFVAAVDALGGVEADIPEPLRDPAAGLDLPRTGRQTLDGEAALALVRSRHPERLIDGRWQDMSEGEGAQQRTAWSGRVLDGVRAALGRADPATLARTAWTASGSLTVGGGIRPLELRRLATAAPGLHELPARDIGDGRMLAFDARSAVALEAAGFVRGCALPG